MNRRDFLKVSALAGGGMILGFVLPGCGGSSPEQRMQDLVAHTGEFQPNAFITITPDNRLLVAVEKSEMGQGVLTSHAMLAAEELDMPIAKVESYHADGLPEYRTSMGMQNTGGSTSTFESYLPIRRAAAVARAILISAAATRWGVPVSTCSTSQGKVLHAETKRSLRYGELATEAASQAIPENVPIKDPSKFKIIGKPLTRVDARSKVTGLAEYGIDVEVLGMVKALVIRPPVMGAPAVELDAAEAKREPGVIDIFVFERGVAVVAQKYWQAKRAAAKVKVKWGDSPLDGFDTEKLRTEMAKRAPESGVNTLRDEGDVEDALEAEGVKRLEVAYEAPYLAHAPMEPMNCIAHAREDSCEIWAPTQGPTVIQETVAGLLGYDRDDVLVHVTMMGGGFGRRGVPDFAAEAALVSKHVNRPVQVIWSREDDTQGGYFRPISYNLMRGAVDAQGKPVALWYHSLSQPIMVSVASMFGAAMPDWIPMVMRRLAGRSVGTMIRTGSLPDFVAGEGAATTAYAIDNIRVEYTPVHAALPVSFWRSVGHSYNGFVMESFIDELAHLAGKDPYEFRRGLLGKHPRLRHVLERAAKLGSWGKPLPKGWGRGIAVHESFRSYCAEVVEARVDDEGIHVERVTCVIDCGQTVNPDVVKQQMESGIIYGLSAALKQEITYVDGQIQQANFNTFRSLRMFESPEIVVEIVDSDLPPTGVGEPGLPPAAPALANAIFAATGIRLRRMPFEKALKEYLMKPSQGGGQ